MMCCGPGTGRMMPTRFGLASFAADESRGHLGHVTMLTATVLVTINDCMISIHLKSVARALTC